MTETRPIDAPMSVVESRMERVLAIVLATGVAISATLVTAGFITSFLVGWTGSLIGAQTLAVDATDFSGVIDRLAQLQPLALVQTGLMVLIATPVFRVGVSVLAFWRQRDVLYVGLTVVVLALLVISIGLLR